MSDLLPKELLAQAISRSSVKVQGLYTTPRSWGVYKIAPAQKYHATKRFRFGNYPVRQQELEAEFGVVKLVALFSVRVFAQQLAFHLNRE
jgi:hypothetical protein